MSRPVVSEFTELLYDSLPEALTYPDAALGWPLLAYLSLEGDVGGGRLLTLLERIDPGRNPSGLSALLDASQADAAWLPWLAQLRGVKLTPGMTEAAQRTLIGGGSAGYLAGTPASIAAAVQTVLTGTRTVRLSPSSVTLPGDGAWYDVLVLTRPEETPDPTAVIPAVIAAGAKPAGVVLHASMLIANYAHLRDVHGTYTALEAALPTYQAMTSHLPE